MRIKQPVPPCIDCVTLPICRTILTNKHELFNMRLLNLLNKCSLLSDYVHATEDLMTCRINRAVIVITSNRIQVEELYERKMY
jgi:hypothetical protein